MKIQTIINYLLMIKLFLILVNSIKIINSESLLNNNYELINELNSLIQIDNINNNNINNNNIQLLDCNINFNNFNFNYQINNNNTSQTNISCYKNIFKRDITLNCNSDKNQEFNKVQKSNFEIDQNINLIVYKQLEGSEKINGGNIIIIEQSFKTFPTGSGSIIINNVNEHIAFFQTLFKLENSIVCGNLEFESEKQEYIQNNQCGNIKLDSYIYQDPYGKIFITNNNHTTAPLNISNNNEKEQYWSVFDESNQLKSKLVYHQNYPFNTIQQLPSNKNFWFKESIKKMKTGRTIPDISFSSISGKLITKWIIPNNFDFILLNTSYTHSMGDLVLSGRHVEHNDYKLVEYGVYDIKKINFNTNEIIPYKRKFF